MVNVGCGNRRNGLVRKMWSIALIGAAFILLVHAEVISNLHQLPLDENNRLQSHWLLYSNTGVCKDVINKAWLPHHTLRNLAPMDGPVDSLLFNEPTNENSCNIACLEKGTLDHHIPYVLPTRLFSYVDDIEAAKDFISTECQSIEMGYILHEVPVAEIFWLNSAGKLQYLMDLHQGEQKTVWQHTYLGHQFEVRDKETGRVLLAVTAEQNGIHVIGQYKIANYLPHAEAIIKNTLDHEWDRAHRVKRTFTDVGFALGKLPVDLYASMSAYYYNNRNNLALEEWDDKGAFVNWWEAPAYMIAMPWGLKKYWQARLKDLVEEWSGEELELTDIYGMRQYTDGARLLTHVDREETHAASLIVNIAQESIRQPWAVEIYDFANRLHEITMDPGDIVYYESARCLHGRMKPLEGAFYVNLFAHYRPKGGDRRWYSKPNPQGTPEQLHDIGQCQLEDNVVNCSKGRKLPFLSPQLETLNGPKDLFKYWKKVSPNVTTSRDNLAVDPLSVGSTLTSSIEEL